VKTTQDRCDIRAPFRITSHDVACACHFGCKLAASQRQVKRDVTLLESSPTAHNTPTEQLTSQPEYAASTGFKISDGCCRFQPETTGCWRAACLSSVWSCSPCCQRGDAAHDAGLWPMEVRRCVLREERSDISEQRCADSVIAHSTTLNLLDAEMRT
jgi:hypothetical protein